MEEFRRLGDEVAWRWSDRDFQVDAFADIATSSLVAAAVNSSVTIERIAEWLFTASDLPEQHVRGFGQPPINVYRNERFYIEVLFWLNTPTSIHQHGFAGAFCVLHGSSLHSEYGFALREQLSPQLQLGELELQSCELLRKGDVRTILPGNAFIHSLLHLQSPSVSVVVRTPQLASYQPQYRYTAPGLAVDPFHRPEPLQTKLQMLSALSVTRPELYAAHCESLVNEADLWTACSVIKNVASTAIAGPLFSRLISLLAARHERLARMLEKSIREDLRQRLIARAMKSVGSFEARVLFALLMNAPDRETILPLVKSVFPGASPEETIVDTISELSHRRQLGEPLDGLPVRLPLEYALKGATLSDLCAAVDAYDIPLIRKTWFSIHSVELLRPLMRSAHPVRAQVIAN